MSERLSNEEIARRCEVSLRQSQERRMHPPVRLLPRTRHEWVIVIVAVILLLALGVGMLAIQPDMRAR